MNTHDPNEHRFIEQINTLLDANTADADDRKALQQARARALQATPKRGASMPWMAFALSAALATVLVVNLPGKAPNVATQTPAQSKASVGTAQSAASNGTAKKSAATAVSALELDLIENLELYEDVEFYQWLSEQSEQGAHDA